MEKIKVTYLYLNDLITRFSGISDEDAASLYQESDHNDKQTVKEIIRQYAKPGFLAHGELEKSTFKTDLAYYLTISENQKQEDYPYFEFSASTLGHPIDISSSH